MKRKYFSIILCVLSGLSFFIYFQIVKETYLANYNKLFRNRFLTPIEYYFFQYKQHEYPETIEKVMKFMSDYDSCIDYDKYEYTYFRDYLSKKSKGTIHYIPLYNQNNFKREAYIILSAGFDGKINNHYDWRDTIFINDFQDKIKMYNQNNFKKFGTHNKLFNKIDFNILYYFFGRKDYLVEYVNFIDYCKDAARVYQTLNLEKLIKGVESDYTDYNIISYKGVVLTDTLISNERYIIFRHQDYLIRNKLFDNTKEVFSGDTLIFIGSFDNFDKENMIIDFIYCIQVED